MAVTLDEIDGWLNELGIKYSKEEDSMVLASSNESTTTLHRIRASDEGRTFEWTMGIVDDEKKGQYKLKEHKHLQTVLAYLLQVNLNTKFGTWEYNPSDGAIEFSVEIPLEDATMTFEQFKRICGVAMDNFEYIEGIKKILETGSFPEDSEDEIMQLLSDLLVLAKSEKAGLEAATEDGI